MSLTVDYHMLLLSLTVTKPGFFFYPVKCHLLHFKICLIVKLIISLVFICILHLAATCAYLAGQHGATAQAIQVCCSNLLQFSFWWCQQLYCWLRRVYGLFWVSSWQVYIFSCKSRIFSQRRDDWNKIYEVCLKSLLQLSIQVSLVYSL